MGARQKRQPPQQLALDIGTPNGAVFSECGNYRYLLWRSWDPTRPVLTQVLLNPSTAGAEVNDPTVTRSMRRAQGLGFGGLRICNLFALVSTDPAALRAAADPIGPLNDSYLVDACLDAKLVVVGWGKHGSLRDRDRHVVALLRAAGVELHCLLRNGDGSPAHPLYQPYARKPILYSA